MFHLSIQALPRHKPPPLQLLPCTPPEPVIKAWAPKKVTSFASSRSHLLFRGPHFGTDVQSIFPPFPHFILQSLAWLHRGWISASARLSFFLLFPFFSFSSILHLPRPSLCALSQTLHHPTTRLTEQTTAALTTAQHTNTLDEAPVCIDTPWSGL